MRYPVVIRKEKGSDYGVSVPDLPGCFSAGRAKRINITLPERALTELDACAKSLGETRSGFLLRAALEFIARHRAA
jgi:HicB_like antitoxin of bacterial toxin-antitoxin system